jgi:membrane protein implicated in regulation of membrane protease activity
MEISASTLWWMLAGFAVASELLTGTFYLLMVALGLAAAAVAAHLGLSIGPQIVVAAVIGGGATAAWHWKRAHHPRSAPFQQNRDVNLDIGEQVTVTAWAPDGTSRITYRGSTWMVRIQPGAVASPGMHRVAAVEGNWLVLAPASH